MEDRDDPSLLQVRARAAGDITAHFPYAEVICKPGSDYAHRARVNRHAVADLLRDLVLEISYTTSFKDVALGSSPPNPQRRSAYYATWSAMARMQEYAPYSTIKRSVAEEQEWQRE